MEIAFHTRELRTLCERDEHPGELSTDVYEALKRRLADLRAAVSVNDLPGRFPTAFGDHSEFLRIELSHDHALILKANHVGKPVREDGTVDWASVSRVMVMAIESTDS